MTLLREARSVGLQVSVSGELLVVTGPPHLEPIARSLLNEKPQVIEALFEELHEVSWRSQAMRPQGTREGALPLLLARRGVRFPLGTCCSCGDPLLQGDRF